MTETGGAVRRARATSFGVVAHEYDLGRPRYPLDAVRWLAGDARLIIELGAGTGKLTASLTAFAPVIATEPLPEMLAVLRHNAPAAMVAVAAAESIPVSAAVADVVIAAQSFHWFDAAATLRSAARVLRPGGAMAVVWNVRDNDVPWVAELTAITGSSENLRAGWDDAFAGSPFGPLEHAQFRHSHTHDVESLCAFAASRSDLVLADPARQAEVLGGVRRLVATHPDLGGRRTFELPYFVECFRARLR